MTSKERSHYRKVLDDIAAICAPKWTILSDGSVDKQSFRWSIEKILHLKYPKVADEIRNDAILRQTIDAVNRYIRLTNGDIEIDGVVYKTRLLVQVNVAKNKWLAKKPARMKVREARKHLRYWENIGQTADAYVDWLRGAITAAERQGLSDDDDLSTVIKSA